jgi:aspartyl protease family protein
LLKRLVNLDHRQTGDVGRGMQGNDIDFYVEPTVNGARLRMMVDAGATLVILSREDASGPALIQRLQCQQIPRMASRCSLRSCSMKSLSARSRGRIVPAAVLPDNTLGVGLLGMSFLSKLSHFEVTGGQLVLKQ